MLHFRQSNYTHSVGRVIISRLDTNVQHRQSRQGSINRRLGAVRRNDGGEHKALDAARHGGRVVARDGGEGDVQAVVVRQEIASESRRRGGRGRVAGDGNARGVEVWPTDLDGDVAADCGVGRCESERVDGGDDKRGVRRRAACDESSYLGEWRD